MDILAIQEKSYIIRRAKFYISDLWMVIWESNIVLHERYLFCPNVNNCGSSFGITYILRAVFWFLANNRQSNTMNIDL